MQPHTTLGTAYSSLRSTMDDLTAKLGADNFARAVVTLGAREAMGLIMRNSRPQGFKSFLPFCEPLLASPEQFQAVATRLCTVFSLRNSEPLFSGSLARGSLVIRGQALFYETPEAASMFAHIFSSSGSAERWTAALTTDAEVYLAENNLPKPAVTVAHTKSEEAALKALLRFAEQHFRTPLEKVEALEG